jgi:hypothetical protein
VDSLLDCESPAGAAAFAAKQQRIAARIAETQRRESTACLAAAVTARLREHCTPAELLRDRDSRRALWAAESQGKKYIESAVATRAVVIEALAVLHTRQVRRSNAGVVKAARERKPGRIANLLAGKICAAKLAAAAAQAKRIAAGKLGAAATRKMIAAGWKKDRSNAEHDGLIRCVVNAVGRIGDQAEDDLDQMRQFEEFSGKRGRHHKLEGSSVESIQIGAGWREVLVTMRDYCSFGFGGGERYHSQGGCSYRCYLVVRDSTLGEAHVLRVPPKFGNASTKFYATFASDKARVAAAVAWTFGMEAREYRPSVHA